jgi:hypothetical protein
MAARTRQRTPVRAVLTAGAVAGALGSIVALAVAVYHLIPRPGPEGTVAIKVLSTSPMTYGDWLKHENVRMPGVPAARLRTPGRFMLYDVSTDHFETGAVLPVRFHVNGEVTRTFSGDPLEVTRGKTCGCKDWLPLDWVPPRAARKPYTIDVEVNRPGPIEDTPLRSAASAPFVLS